jgi:DNA replication and repair protein RecF
MSIKNIKISTFRSIGHVDLSPGQDLNLIIGPNGSGKTSILEAIYYLGRGKSFRTSNIKKIIQHNQTNFILHANINTHNSQNISIGIEKRSNQSTIKISGEHAKSSSQLANYLPILLIHPESHQLLEQGPKLRRHFINWGLFHVEQSFLSLWNQFNKTLKQRNALLKNMDYSQIKIWDKKISVLAHQIDEMRYNYINMLSPSFRIYCKNLLGLTDVKIIYRRGWAKGSELFDELQRSVKSDMEAGYTRAGPQRADIIITEHGQHTSQLISRGQQKLVITALLLAQADHLANKTGKNAIILVDDIPAELDSQHLQRLFSTLISLNSQLFITATSKHLFSSIDFPDSHKMFHVEHGAILQ